jgi:hypothetical protein
MSYELWRVCGLKRKRAEAELVRKPCRIRDADPHLRPGLRRYAPGAVALAYRVFSRLSLCVVKLESCVCWIRPGAANFTTRF